MKTFSELFNTIKELNKIINKKLVVEIQFLDDKVSFKLVDCGSIILETFVINDNFTENYFVSSVSKKLLVCINTYVPHFYCRTEKQRKQLLEFKNKNWLHYYYG